MPTSINKSKQPSRSARTRMIHFSLCVVRHGETMENRNNIYQGQLDTVLSDEGIKQAQLVAVRLQDEKFTHIFSSDLQRAYKTAGYIMEQNKYKEGLEIVKDQKIREKAYGIMEGKTEADFHALLVKHNATAKSFIPEGGETITQLRARAVEFLDDLCSKIVKFQKKKKKKLHNNPENSEDSSGKRDGPSASSSAEMLPNTANHRSTSFAPVANVLMASHGGTIRQLAMHFAHEVPSEFLGKGKRQAGSMCPNTGVSKFDIFVNEESEKAEFVRCVMLYDGSHLRGVIEDLDSDRPL